MNSSQRRNARRKHDKVYAIVDICMAHARMIGCHVNTDWCRISGLGYSETEQRYPYLIFDGTLEKWINIGISDDVLILQDELNEIYRSNRSAHRTAIANRQRGATKTRKKSKRMSDAKTP